MSNNLMNGVYCKALCSRDSESYSSIKDRERAPQYHLANICS